MMATVSSLSQQSQEADGNGSSIEDIWNNLKDLDNSANEEYKKRSQTRLEAQNNAICLEEKISKKKVSKNKSEKKVKKLEKDMRGGGGDGLESKRKGREVFDETPLVKPCEVRFSRCSNDMSSSDLSYDRKLRSQRRNTFKRLREISTCSSQAISRTGNEPWNQF
jgi:hypothetical protein